MSTHKSTDYKFSAVEYYLNTDNISLENIILWKEYIYFSNDI